MYDYKRQLTLHLCFDAPEPLTDEEIEKIISSTKYALEHTITDYAIPTLGSQEAPIDRYIERDGKVL